MSSLEPIHGACLRGDLEYVKKCYRDYLQHKNQYANPFTQLYTVCEYICGYPLHAAAKGGHKRIIAYLLANSKPNGKKMDFVDINCRDSNGNTPLFYAYYYRNRSCMDFLIKSGSQTMEVDVWKQFAVKRCLPYLQFVDGVDELPTSISRFCDNEDWTRELMSYISVFDEHADMT